MKSNNLHAIIIRVGKTEDWGSAIFFILFSTVQFRKDPEKLAGFLF